MFTDGKVHVKPRLLTELSAACVGEPKVPILLLDISPGGNRQIGPELNGLSSTQRRDNDVRAVVAAALNVHSDDGEGCHPRVVGDVGLQADGRRSVAVVGQGAVERGQLIGCHSITVGRVITVHVNGVVRNSAHTEMDKVVDVETFAGHAAVGGEKDTEGVGTATEEHLWIGQIGDLLPRDLRVPRKVRPLTWCSAWVALGDVPGNGFERVVDVA